MDEDFHKLFEDLVNRLAVEEYNPTEGVEIQAPPYIPTPKHCGPQPITIEQYLERNKSKKQRPVPPVTPTKKKTKGGKKKRLNREKAELRRLISLSSGPQKKLFYNKLKELEK